MHSKTINQKYEFLIISRSLYSNHLSSIYIEFEKRNFRSPLGVPFDIFRIQILEFPWQTNLSFLLFVWKLEPYCVLKCRVEPHYFIYVQPNLVQSSARVLGSLLIQNLGQHSALKHCIRKSHLINSFKLLNWLLIPNISPIKHLYFYVHLYNKGVSCNSLLWSLFTFGIWRHNVMFIWDGGGCL